MYKIVNLETFTVSQDTVADLLKQEIGNIKQVLGLLLLDGFLFNNKCNIDLLDNSIDLHVVAGIVNDQHQYKNIIHFDFMMHTVFMGYKNKETYIWNKNSNKFLFLGGVPNRFNRAGLLNKFRKSDLLKHSVYTFFKPWTEEQEQWCKNNVDGYDKIIEQSIDDVYSLSKHYGTNPSQNVWTKNIGWIDPAVYKSTVLSIISEGVSSNDLTSRYLTEKTYRVFVQRHPFLHASTPDMFRYIKELGFKTFEEYMIIQDYAYLNNEDERLQAIVKNTKYFLENYRRFEDDIENDINYNYDHFFKLAQSNADKLLYIKDKFNIEQDEIDKWFNQTGFSHLIRKFQQDENKIK